MTTQNKQIKTEGIMETITLVVLLISSISLNFILIKGLDEETTSLFEPQKPYCIFYEAVNNTGIVKTTLIYNKIDGNLINKSIDIKDKYMECKQ